MSYGLPEAATNWVTTAPEVDLTLRQIAVLYVVAANPTVPSRVRRLANRLNLSKPVISRALHRLKHDGLVSSQRDPNDGRDILIEPTLEGIALINRMTASTT
jgi:DNA-binding MarR family transcriptional regulator